MTKQYTKEEMNEAWALYADLDEDVRYQRRDFLELENRIDAFIASQKQADLIRLISCLKYSWFYLAYKVSVKDKGKWAINYASYKGEKAVALHTSYRRIHSSIAMRYRWHHSPHEFLYEDIYGTSKCLVINPASDFVVLQRSLIDEVFSLLDKMEKEAEEKDVCTDNSKELLEIMAKIDLEKTKPLAVECKLDDGDLHRIFYVCEIGYDEGGAFLFKEQGKEYFEIPFDIAIKMPELSELIKNEDGHFFPNTI